MPIFSRFEAMQEVVLRGGTAAPTAPKAPRSVGAWVRDAQDHELTAELREAREAMRAQHREDSDSP